MGAKYQQDDAAPPALKKEKQKIRIFIIKNQKKKNTQFFGQIPVTKNRPVEITRGEVAQSIISSKI